MFAGNANAREIVIVTERDQSIVEWLGRIGAASAADVMARFGIGRSQTYYRLRLLVRAGLLEPHHLLRGQGVKAGGGSRGQG